MKLKIPPDGTELRAGLTALICLEESDGPTRLCCRKRANAAFMQKLIVQSADAAAVCKQARWCIHTLTQTPTG